MGSYQVSIQTQLKPLVNNPEGNTIGDALISLGFDMVTSVRSGDTTQFVLKAKSYRDAEEKVRQMVQHRQNPLKLNPVLQVWEIKIEWVRAKKKVEV